MPNDRVTLSVRIGKLALENPLVAASGAFGWGGEFQALHGFDIDRLGAIVLKGTTLQPRMGNPTPRIVETASGMLNSIGLQNPGVDEVIRTYLPALKDCKAKVIANVAGKTVDEYAEVTKRFDSAERIDAIELNISCPNVKQGGIFFGSSPESAAEVIAACRKVTSKTLIAKLSPNVTDIAEIAFTGVEAGADVLSVANTIRGIAISVETRRPVLGQNFGGISGPAIKPIALLKVHEVYQAIRPTGTDIPIIGCGGIMNARDALEFIVAGATAFQIGTALFREPLAPMKILSELPELMRDIGETDINRLIGTLQMNEEVR